MELTIHLTHETLAKLNRLGREREMVGSVIARLLDAIPAQDAAALVGHRPITVIREYDPAEMDLSEREMA